MGHVVKRLLRLDRRRMPPPEGFGWVDRRLVRDHWIGELSPTEALLYLFLLCVSDKDGLSYYGDHTLARLISISPPALQRARRALQDKELITYEAPLYQVLALPRANPPQQAPAAHARPRDPSAPPTTLGAILAALPIAQLAATRCPPTPGDHPRKPPESRAL